MSVVTLQEAQTSLKGLINRAIQGEEILIEENGTPLAKLVPCPVALKNRVPGLLKGQIWMADDFDELPEDILAVFNGESK